jgi:hypothetical protein
LESFTSGLTETQVRETFPKLAFRCVDGANPFGNRLCAAEIGAFNGMPTSSVTLFLVGEGLRAVKVSYRRAYHQWFRDWVEGRIAALDDGEMSKAAPEIQDGVAAWTVPDGLLILRDGPLEKNDDPALLWLSRAAIAAQGHARSADQPPFN